MGVQPVALELAFCAREKVQTLK